MQRLGLVPDEVGMVIAIDRIDVAVPLLLIGAVVVESAQETDQSPIE